MRTELVLPTYLAEKRVDIRPNGDIKVRIPLPGGTYQMEWERAYGSEVFSPETERFRDFVDGSKKVRLTKRKLLFGATLNGVCPANCLDCPFGRIVMGKEYAHSSEEERPFTKARPITPEELKTSLNYAKEVAIQNGTLQKDELFGAGNYLAGELGYCKDIWELMTALSYLNGCESSHWSTIAPKNANKVLESLERGVAVSNPNHRLSMQVSLHSTQPVERINHTGEDGLYSMEEIAQWSKRITKLTGRRVSLAFVLHAGSVIEPEVLRKIFVPDYNIISLRPIYSTSTRPLDSERLIELYTQLRKDHWDVVYMPPRNGNRTDGSRPIELENMRVK